MAVRKKYRMDASSYSKYSFGFRRKRGILKFIFKAIFSRKFLRFFIAFLLLSFIGGALAVGGAFLYYAKDLPGPDKIINNKQNQSTKIFDRAGSTLLYEIHGEEKRTIVKFEDISLFVKNATVAVEDKDFYNHKGFDYRGIVRAVWRDIQKGSLNQGGSTITQQLIKNVVLSRERTIERKIKELILAIELERKFSKEEILAMYLNAVPYGSNAYGIEAASQTFFGKNAKDLTLAEAALLAVLPQAPTYYSPYGSRKEELGERYRYVLERMKIQGYISEKEYDEAVKTDIIPQVKKFREKMLAPHFTMYIKESLVEKYGEELMENGGLKVITTLDWMLQQEAEKSVREGVEKNMKKYNAYNAALAAVDPKTGGILAMVGSKDYFAEPDGCVEGKRCKFDPNTNAAISLLSPGSSFKPFVYAAAFQKGYTPDTMLFDLKTEFNSACDANSVPKSSNVRSSDCYHPQNYNGKFAGPVTMRQALAMSLNIPAVKTLYLVGISDSIATASGMGINTLSNPNQYGLALVLGGGGVKLLEETAAYGVFANEGIKKDLSGILKIEDSAGKILEDNSSVSETRALDAEIARQISDILSDNTARAPIFGEKSPLFFSDRSVAAKTGTANEFRHAWTVGYTPGIAVGVWVGNNNNEPMNKGEGVYVAAPIWRSFMDKALAGKPVENFTKPQAVAANKAVLNGQWSDDLKIKIDKSCGDKLAAESTPQDQIDEITYRQVHSILYYVQKDDPRGDAPKEPTSDAQFVNWEASIRKWVEENGYFKKPPTEYCSFHVPENKPFVKILKPADSVVINLKTPVAIDLEADASASLGVKQVGFYLDDNFIEAKSVLPWKISYQLPLNLIRGDHFISARVFDQYGNSNEDKIKIIIERDSEGPELSVKDPVCNKSMCLLGALASDKESGVLSINFYYRIKGSADEFTEIKGDVLSQTPVYQEIWSFNESVATGDYELYAIALDKANNFSKSTIASFKIER